MSDEAESAIEDVFVSKLGAKYPIVKIDGGSVAGYGIKFYPSYYTLDADGNVFATPDDRMPSEGQIEDLLKNVSLAPKMPAGSQFDPLRSMWEKKDYGKIRDYLAKMLAQENLDAELRTAFEEQQKTLDKKVERALAKVEALGRGPDYFRATESLEKMAKDWKGFEVADKAEQELARFKDDATIKKEVAAGKALDKLLSRYDRSKQSQARKLAEALVKFAEKHEGTYAGEQAKKMMGGE